MVVDQMDNNFIDSLRCINKDIKKEYKSLRNRLQSILLDYTFLCTEVLPCFPEYPLVPNERCGLWYCNPKDFTQTSYFKSTDGHTNQWDFSSRRLNFHIIPTIAKSNGIIIVDSTRRGKKVPDALSKTIPIWCAVLNHLMLESQGGSVKQETLYVPPETVSESEFYSIKSRIPELVEKLKSLEVINGKELHKQLGGKLLRPFWIYPGSSILQSTTDIFTGEVTSDKWIPVDNSIIPIILCTVSYQAQDGVDKRRGFTYVQGAADDHELWSHGLNAKIFWSNIDILGNQESSEEELERFVSQLSLRGCDLSKEIQFSDAFPQIDLVTPELSLGLVIDNLEFNPKLIGEIRQAHSLVIVLSQSVNFPQKVAEMENASEFISIHKLQSGSKVSSRNLKTELLKIVPLIEKHILDLDKQRKPVLICCNSGTDMSIGLLLVVLCRNYNMDWQLNTPTSVSKIVVKKHLAKLISHLKGRNVNPPRATLNSVNSYLM
ncbi:tRNA A64-2'-O-ribosylphosphate transferase TDEL_0A07970 [Torulaspora delbrueckii]|uniref:Initiator tRNA phosphoribosyl transferase n=1 Tax=Torulaspora delbrueckii TaxID=4950 RepID=G8ZND5_TORDE|nr:hypothetical protein TDEL_0A07970 [Torulaspora delbrueckii]CCE90129.1 hypothetical protein TDEL_0A07970 [Torulaspora delbrueckii]